MYVCMCVCLLCYVTHFINVEVQHQVRRLEIALSERMRRSRDGGVASLDIQWLTQSFAT